MVTAIGRTVLTGLILGSGVLLSPDLAASRSPVVPPFARAGDPSHDTSTPATAISSCRPDGRCTRRLLPTISS